MNHAEFGQLMASLRGGITTPEAELLKRLASSVEQGCILEVGSFRGKSAVAMALGVRANDKHKPQIYCIDPHQKFVGFYGGEFGPVDRAAFFEAMLKTEAYQEVALINLSSEVIAPGWKEPIGLAFIDGDHTYEGVKRDYVCWLNHVMPGGLIVFDDAADPNCGPAELLREILPSGDIEQIEQVGKIIVTRKKGVAAPVTVTESSSSPEQVKTIDLGSVGKTIMQPTVKVVRKAEQHAAASVPQQQPQVLGGMQATYMAPPSMPEPAPAPTASQAGEERRLRLLVVMERLTDQFGVQWAKRLAETIHPHGFDLVFCCLDRSAEGAQNESLSLEEASQIVWDCTCILGEFSGSLVAGMKGIFNDKRFGTRVQLIDGDESRHGHYLPLNRAIMPHLCFFIDRNWTPGCYTEFFAHRFYGLASDNFMSPLTADPQSPSRLELAQSFLDKLAVDGYEHYTYAPEFGLHGKWPLDVRTQGLEAILSNLQGKHVIDFGCAEGLISRCCLEAGASHVDGFEFNGARVQVAQKLCQQYSDANFYQADISNWQQFMAQHAEHVRLGYDLVLYLGVHQHLPQMTRIDTLRGIAELALDYLVLRMPPADFAADQVDQVLAECGFEAAHDYRPSGTHGLGGALVFKRSN